MITLSQSLNNSFWIYSKSIKAFENHWRHLYLVLDICRVNDHTYGAQAKPAKLAFFKLVYTRFSRHIHARIGLHHD